ncbi:MAG: proline racemase family protein [Candidatus Neomarinimicrobiota bacterium]|nr:proline racemase family protein [Candidatus Neomarinimicrobiota bacterium]
MIELNKLKGFTPPSNWIKIQTIEAHTGGEPLRVIVSGYPKLKGDSILSKRDEIAQKYDFLRTTLMWEPRGHKDMYGALIVEPEKSSSDVGIIFMHNNGYSTGCGHAIIALTKIFIDYNVIPIKDPITEVVMDVPSGKINAFAKITDKQIDKIFFNNVPSFVQELDAIIEVPSFGQIKYDLAYGGAFYAVIDIDQLGISLDKKYLDDIVIAGKKIKKAISKNVNCVHPIEPEMNDLYGIIFVDQADRSYCHSKNICIFADGELDRSPTGTGVSARAAIEFLKGNLGKNEPMLIESITGSIFSVSVEKSIDLVDKKAIVPQVSGQAWVTGSSTFWIDPNDPLKNGFLLK